MTRDARPLIILERFNYDKTRLMDIFWALQDDYGYIPRHALEILGEELEMSVIDLEETMSFYHFFKPSALARNNIYLSDTVIARHAGYADVLEAFEKETGEKFDEASKNGIFCLKTTACIGLSDQEPAALINLIPFNNLTPSKVKNIVNGLLKGHLSHELANPTGLAQSSFSYVQKIVETNIKKSGPVFFQHLDYKQILEKALDSRQDIIDIVIDSNLRGRGGAGFPTGTKWKFCRDNEADQRYIVCNADEGEPGTFKDRALLSHSPRQVFLGMTIAAIAVAASEGIVYLRAEYRYMLDYLEARLQELREEGLLGKNILATGLDFDIRIQLGAGAYVCGEETALLESLEGKRGTPRLKPPFPVEAGYLGKPTVINNVESFAAVSRIIENGADWFKSLGTKQSAGTRLLSISGDCAQAGIYEVEWGVSLNDVLTMAEAKDAYAAQVSGPSGQLVNVAAEAERKICFEDLNCGGSFMIFNKDRDLLEIINHFSKFFVSESCGICVPCRAGNVELSQKLSLFVNERGSEKDMQDMRLWSKIISQNSRCGLGIASPNSIINSLDKFPHIYQEKIKKTDDVLLPSFDLDIATADYDKIVERQKA